MRKTSALDKLKEANEKIKAQEFGTPLQETKPVKSKVDKKSSNYHLNAFIPKDLAMKLKVKALKEDKTLTDIVIETLSAYVNK